MSWGYLEDASGAKGYADRICIPKDESELLAELADARLQLAPVTIAGGGSGLTGGRVPHGGWLISMEKFRRLDVAPGKATVGAGITLHELHAAAKLSGQFYPPDPTETMAFLGGTIACNSSGSRSFMYGATRRWIQRLRVVLPNGEILDVRRGDAINFDVPEIPQPAARKHSCGYPLRPGMDWIDLFTGAEGTLGIVLEAELRLLPTPRELLNGIVFFPSDESALDALDAWRSVTGLRMLEYVDDPALRMIAQRYPDVPDTARAALIIEQILEDDGDVDAWAHRLAEADAFEDKSWFGTSDADRERFRKFRHALPETALEISVKKRLHIFGYGFFRPGRQEPRDAGILPETYGPHHARPLLHFWPRGRRPSACEHAANNSSRVRRRIRGIDRLRPPECPARWLSRSRARPRETESQVSTAPVFGRAHRSDESREASFRS